MITFRHLLFTFLLVLVVLLGKCPCMAEEEEKCPCKADEEESDEDKTKALRYKIGAIASILTAGAIGVCLPVLGKTIPALSPEKNIFYIIKAFAAGVILSTGFIHVLPDAFESLKSPCLPSSPWDFPFTGFVAMVSAMLVLMIDAFATSYFRKPGFVNAQHGGDEEQAGHVHGHTHAAHGHAHGVISSSADGESELLRHRVIAQVLELGIVVHSVIIGIAVGVSGSPKFIRPLFAALTLHQFFEGMGLGSSIAQAKFKAGTFILMGLFFSLTTPVGIVIGIVIAKGYDENSHTALIVKGVLNAASAGILIYMSLVDLLAQDFMNPRMQNNTKLLIGANVSLLLGAGCMTVLAKWA